MKFYKMLFVIFAIASLFLFCSCSNNSNKQAQQSDIITSTSTETEIANNIYNEDNSTIYKTAIENLNSNNLSYARELFTYLGDYQDANEYVGLIDFTTNIYGDYYFVRAGDSKYTFHITKNSVKVENPSILYSDIYDSLSFSKDDEYGYKLVAKNGYATYIFVKKDGIVYYRSVGDTYTNSDYFDETEYSRLYLQPDDYVEPQEPEIGMTAEEVKNSTWGKPTKINKTTTKYGVHEQWVYSSGKYIYFDDGVVTSIQE